MPISSSLTMASLWGLCDQEPQAAECLARLPVEEQWTAWVAELAIFLFLFPTCLPLVSACLPYTTAAHSSPLGLYYLQARAIL